VLWKPWEVESGNVDDGVRGDSKLLLGESGVFGIEMESEPGCDMLSECGEGVLVARLES